MAKFCVKCGNRLDVSGICSCERPAYQAQAAPEEKPVYQEQSVPEERPAYQAQTVPEERPVYHAQAAPEERPVYQEQTVPVERPAYQPQAGPEVNYNQESTVEHAYGNTYHSEVDYNKKANQAKKVLSTGYNKVMDIMISLLKHPFSKGIAFSNSEDLKSASIIIGLHALFAAIFTALSFSRLTQIFEVFNGILYELTGYSDILNMKFPMINIFLITLIGSAAFSMIYAGTLLLFSIIFKNNVSYKTVVCAVASRSAIIIPVIALSIVLIFIIPFLGIILFTMGNFAGIAYITQVFPVTKIKNRDYVPLIVFLGTVVFLVVTYFVFINSYSMYLPADLKELIPYFEELMSNIGASC